MLKNLLVVCAIATTVFCRNTASNYNALNSDQLSDKMIGNNDKNDESFLNWMDISSIYHKYKNYTSNDISVFLKLKLLSSIDAVAKRDFDLGNGIRFIQDESVEIDSRRNDADELNENAILKSLPRTLNEKEDVLSSLIWKRISKLLRSHTLQVSRTLRKFHKELARLFRFVYKHAVPQFILDSLVFLQG